MMWPQLSKRLSEARHLGASCPDSGMVVEYLQHDVEVLQLMAKSGYQNRIELLQGTLDMLILKTLMWGEQHGYGISRAIRASSGEVLQVETGSLYPALHRLERAKWVSAEWKKSDSNQKARFYRITPLGKKQLAADYKRWEEMVTIIEGIMRASGSEA
jgi:PadR family transcriptional regulator PadR